MKRYVYVIEILWNDGGWRPCVACALTQEEAADKLTHWKEHNPSNKFRWRKYVPEVQP